MREVEGSEQTFECDLVLLAMGFVGPEQPIIEQLKLAKDPRNNIAVSRGKYGTELTNIYAAGGKHFKDPCPLSYVPFRKF